jgi:hypothetical protein
VTTAGADFAAWAAGAEYTHRQDKRSRITGRLAAWKRRFSAHGWNAGVRSRLRACRLSSHCLIPAHTCVLYEDDEPRCSMPAQVFAPELIWPRSPRRGPEAGSDAYGRGPNRSPRGRITVEQAARFAATGCCGNPRFHQASGAPEERMRLTTNIPPEPQP